MAENERITDEQFEDRLKEILYSGPETVERADQKREVGQDGITAFHRKEKEKSSSIAEIIIRLVAAILVVGLLIRFGIQMASR